MNLLESELLRHCPDLKEWPKRWHRIPADLEYGLKLLEVFKPFLMHLVAQGLSTKTLKKHIDNTWLLGGELIDRLHWDPELREIHALELVQSYVDETGGPYSKHLTTEAEIASFDSTCRKLNRFLHRKDAA